MSESKRGQVQEANDLGTQTDVDVYCTTCLLTKMDLVKVIPDTLYYHQCPFYGEAWHMQAYGLTVEINNTASVHIEKILRVELEELLKTRVATKLVGVIVYDRK